MNAQPAITREELDDGFAQLRDEIVALKKAVASIAARGEAETPDFRAGDVVHRDEFRLFKWASGLALAAILGGLGFFYQGFADLRVTVERQHGESRSYMDRRFGEMDRQFAEMQGEMDRRFAEVRGEMDRRFTEVHSEMDRRFTEVEQRFTEVEQRFTEVEQRLTGVEQRLTGVEQRLTEVEKRLTDIRERLVRVETLVAGESPASEVDGTDAH